MKNTTNSNTVATKSADAANNSLVPSDIQQGALANLLLEIKLKNFSELHKDRVQVVCLGLACKSLYIAWQDHVQSKNQKSKQEQPKCRLNEWTLTFPRRQLHMLIHEFFPKDFIYYNGGKYGRPVYATDEKLERLVAHDEHQKEIYIYWMSKPLSPLRTISY